MNIGFKAHYFKELADLEASNFWFRSRNKLIVWALHKYCLQSKSFLEIGCGTGFVLSEISKRFPSMDLSGSEFMEEGLVYARSRIPTAIFSQMDARHMPYKSKFEAIGAFDVLEHILEDVAVLDQISNALKPGGVALITIPQHRRLWSVVDEYACHVRRYEVDEIHKKIRESGFSIVRSTSFVSLLLPAMFLSRYFKKNKVDAKMDDMAELRINPCLNWIFERIMNIEISLIRAGLDFPLGGSRLVVASKPLAVCPSTY